MSEEYEQGCEWLRLYRRIKRLLKQHGKSDYEGGLEIADFLLVQDNWGGPLHQVEIHSLHLLQPAIVKSIQGLLVEFPEWEIVVRVDVPGREDAWPGMGLTIYADSICDALKREYCPRSIRGSLTKVPSRSRLIANRSCYLIRLAFSLGLY
jgi:hypothetical protein